MGPLEECSGGVLLRWPLEGTVPLVWFPKWVTGRAFSVGGPWESPGGGPWRDSPGGGPRRSSAGGSLERSRRDFPAGVLVEFGTMEGSTNGVQWRVSLGRVSRRGPSEGFPWRSPVEGGPLDGIYLSGSHGRGSLNLSSGGGSRERLPSTGSPGVFSGAGPLEVVRWRASLGGVH
jgi:hypothetical protein